MYVHVVASAKPKGNKFRPVRLSTRPASWKNQTKIVAIVSAFHFANFFKVNALAALTNCSCKMHWWCCACRLPHWVYQSRLKVIHEFMNLCCQTVICIHPRYSGMCFAIAWILKIAFAKIGQVTRGSPKIRGLTYTCTRNRYTAKTYYIFSIISLFTNADVLQALNY